MSNIKQEIVNYLITNGKTESWAKIADLFGVCQDCSNKQKSDYIRGIYRRISTRDTKVEDLNSNMKLTKRWFNGKEWCESYKAENVDVSELEDFKERFLNDIKSIKVPDTKNYYTKDQIGVAYEISLPDFHFGKHDGLTIQEQADKFYNAIVSLHKKAYGLNIKRFILPIGNDIFNSDGIAYTTTKGTPQFDNSQWQDSFRVGWLAVIKCIEYLKRFALVDVIIVQGNHDWQKSFYLGEILDATYSSSKHVTVDNSTNSPRKYYSYGKVLLGFTHGDSEKISELPLIMANECPKEWAQATYKEWHIGHTHKTQHEEFQGVGVKTLPSLVGQDEWHKRMGYNSPKKAQAYIWNSETGLEGFLQING